MEKNLNCVKVTKLNTAVICFSDGDGGMEMDAIKLAKKLSPYTKITLIAKAGSFIEKSKSEYSKGVDLYTIKFKYKFSFNVISKVRQLIQQKQIKNVIFLGASEMASLYFAFLGLDVNLIVRHGTTKSTSKKDWYHRLIYKNINYHVTISKHLKRNVNRIFPMGSHTKSVLIYNSVNTRDAPYNKPKKLTLLHVGRVVHGKGQTDAITACEILEQHNIDFAFNIVGNLSDDYKKEFLSFYNRCPYKEKINLIGHSNNIFQYFEEADIFLCPSHAEGLSNAILEAFSTNINIICYDNTVFPEFNKLGFKFEMARHLNIDDLKGKLLQMVQNLSKKRTTHNSTLVKKIFSSELNINNYMKILQ